MKEKIIEILESYQAKGLDRIRNVKNLSGWISPAGIPLIADELEPLINQEVEKRIAGRMPSEEWTASEARKRFTSNTGFFESAKYQGFIRCGKWLRSRLSQKTEGGEG